MRRLTPFGLLFVYLIGSPALAMEPEYEVIQPVQSPSRIVLLSAQGKARIEREGAADQSLALRADEVLTTIAETRGGWTAAGVRAEDSAARLMLIRRGIDGTRRVAAPALRRHPLQLRPTLAVRGDDLEGMAWLEGPDLTSLAVRAAAHDGRDWDEVTIVAGPARGSQTGLVAAVLADGRWLLAWSAFDGRDDDILWSVGRQGDWTVPQRVGRDNPTPDITPALVATAEGALLVWSRMHEGHYRMMLSRYSAAGWSTPEVVGPPGSLEPGFTLLDGQLLLLYRHAWPQGWAVTELSSRGRSRRLAVLDDDQGTRPALLRSSGEDVELGWANQRRRVAGWEGLP